MTFWFHILDCILIFLLGRGLNIWQTSTHGGTMPLSFPWGDWIPCLGHLASIGDALQLGALIAIVLATLIRFNDERYTKRAPRE